MTISFVIPARNEEKLISQTIQAILNQKNPALIKEIIVVNNGSTDKTAEVAKSFGWPVKVINQPIPGLPLTRFTGFKKAKGEIIASIDADTIVPSRWAERVVKLFKNRPKLVAVGGPYIYKEKGSLRLIILSYAYATLIMEPVHEIVNLLKLGGVLNGGNFAFRRSALPVLKNYVKDVQFYGEDVYMAKKLRTKGPIEFSLLLPANTSPRRFQKQGLLKTVGKYALNMIAVTATGKPFKFK